MTYGLVRVAVLGIIWREREGERERGEREKSRFKFNCQLNATFGGY